MLALLTTLTCLAFNTAQVDRLQAGERHDGLQRATLNSFKRRLSQKTRCLREAERKEHTLFRHGSNERDSSSSTERPSPVMLSVAKHLAADRDRPFATLRVTCLMLQHEEEPIQDRAREGMLNWPSLAFSLSGLTSIALEILQSVLMSITGLLFFLFGVEWGAPRSGTIRERERPDQSSTKCERATIIRENTSRHAM